MNLADLGAEKYSGLWDGTTDWMGDDVKGALSQLGENLVFFVFSEVGVDLARLVAARLVEVADAAGVQHSAGGCNDLVLALTGFAEVSQPFDGGVDDGDVASF